MPRSCRSACHPRAGAGMPCSQEKRLSTGKSVPVTWRMRASSEEKSRDSPLACNRADRDVHCKLAMVVPNGEARERLPDWALPCRSKTAVKPLLGALSTRIDSRPCQCALGSTMGARVGLAQPPSTPSSQAKRISQRGRENLTASHEADSWFQSGCRSWGSIASRLAKPLRPLRAGQTTIRLHPNGRLSPDSVDL